MVKFVAGRNFAFAGIWECWEQGEGGPLYTFTIVTTEPNELISGFHNRMPVMLQPEDEAVWLDPRAGRQELQTLLKAYPPAGMRIRKVSRLVNSPGNEGPELLALWPDGDDPAEQPAAGS